MGMAIDIFHSWRHPRQVMALRLSQDRQEGRLFMYLLLSCLLIFMSRWPGLAREAQIDPSTPLDMRLGGALFAWMFIVPLLLYVIAALSHVVSRVLGGKGSWYSARLALFWSLLAATPFWLMNGMAVGYAVPAGWQQAIGAIALAAFLLIWLSSLIQAEFGGDPI